MNDLVKKFLIPMLICSGLIWIMMYSLIKLAEPNKTERIQKERKIKVLPTNVEIKKIENE